MISQIDEIVEAARAGHPVIMIDAETRKNEGHLILPAQFVDADAVNFMAIHCRGIVSLALTGARAEALGLRPMARRNESRYQMAYTVSIEARAGVSTGISAADRAQTIRTAMHPKAGALDIVTPGHVFPIVASDGGLAVRPGHTEAAIEICQRAGLIPAAAVCAILGPDGAMATRAELNTLAEEHDLRVGLVSDLIAARANPARLAEAAVLPFYAVKQGSQRLAAAG